MRAGKRVIVKDKEGNIIHSFSVKEAALYYNYSAANISYKARNGRRNKYNKVSDGYLFYDGNMPNANLYACYKGDEYLGEDTRPNWSKRLGIKEDTIVSHACASTWQRRPKGYIFVKLENDDI